MLLRTILTGIILTAGALAQLSSFPKPSYFRETFSKAQTKVELKDPVRLKDFVAGDKLELSLKNYLELVMANNTDIQIQLLTVETPKNAILRAFGAWDPLAQASFNNTRSTNASVSSLEGAATVKSLSQPATFSVGQTLPTGTTYTASFAAAKNTTNNSNTFFNPALTAALSLNFSQPLLKNRGSYVNKLNLMSAQSKYKGAGYNLTGQLLTMVNAAENTYWDVVQARENLKVAEAARDTAGEFLKLSQKQLELGALSPLDIYNPQQQLATAELGVSQAKFNLAQKEDALRRQIGADLDPNVRKLPIVLTETVDIPETVTVDPEQAIQQAMSNRPDLKLAAQNLDVDDLALASARNGLLPNLALTGNYTSNGRGGIFTPRTSAFSDPATAVAVASVPGGFSDALGQLFGFGFSSYSFGLRLTLPIKSRIASADMADAVIAKRRDALTQRTTEQSIRLDILNAVTNLDGSKEQLKLAKLAMDFAQKNLDAENKKYELGTEINQNVILAQNALTGAQSSVVTNQIQLRRNLLNLITKTGTLLDDRGIVIK